MTTLATAGLVPLRPDAGLRALWGLAVRRDRIVVPVWTMVLAGVAGLAAAATGALYPSAADRLGAAAAIDAAPALRAVYGPVAASAELGALALWKLGVLGALATALFAGTTVVRHSRAEEEAGRLDLLAAAAVGRVAPAVAALAAGVGAALLVTLATTVVLIGVGLPVAGSLAFGATWGAAGIVFAGVALVAAQLVRSARAARAALVAALLAAYLLRAAGGGGVGPAWLVWASPLGWGERVEAFGANRWAVLLLSVATAWVLAAVGLELQVRRDVGAGVLPERGGPARASALLRGPLGLAWRLHRVGLAGWAVGLALLGALCGSVTRDLGGLLDSERMRAVVESLGGATGITDAFLAAEFGLLAGVVSLMVVGTVLRATAEERAGRTDVPAGRWVGAHVVVALGGGTAVLGLAGAAAGLARGGAAEVPRLLGAALALSPALVVAAGIAVLAHGLSASAAPAAWGVVAALLLTAELGPVLDAPAWVLDLTPFTHLPRLPGGVVDPVAWCGVLGVGLVLLVAGLVALRRRDIG